MFGSFCILLLSLSSCVAANRVYPPTKVIQLTLGVSKAAYLPLAGNRFIKNGGIVENPTTIVPRFFLGFVPLPPKYDPNQDKFACSIRGWTAKSYEIKETEVLMYKNDQQKLVIFGFRGTEALNLIDWAKNFNLIPKRSTIGNTTFYTHKGFRCRYGYIASWFEREYQGIPADYTILITGHSLGGAEATIAAVYAAGKLKRRPDAVVTYGSPLVGTQSFKNYYNQVVGCDRTLRITAKGDLFTDVPPIFGYTHVCNRIEVDGKTNIQPIKSHDLYGGYELGIRRKYPDMREIHFGCNRVLN